VYKKSEKRKTCVEDQSMTKITKSKNLWKISWYRENLSNTEYRN